MPHFVNITAPLPESRTIPSPGLKSKHWHCPQQHSCGYSGCSRDHPQHFFSQHYSEPWAERTHSRVSVPIINRPTLTSPFFAIRISRDMSVVLGCGMQLEPCVCVSASKHWRLWHHQPLTKKFSLLFVWLKCGGSRDAPCMRKHSSHGASKGAAFLAFWDPEREICRNIWILRLGQHQPLLCQYNRCFSSQRVYVCMALVAMVMPFSESVCRRINNAH